ncbi:MAG: endolytic transglycosylase MltG [Alphaproteobacteria bacterium]|nr:MAG: endolytic transglycosylase MltG [Alphaproteobacteria bacterium]
MKRIILALALSMILACGAVLSYYHLHVKPFWVRSLTYEESSEILITQGSSSQKIIAQLADAGLISDPLSFRIMATLAQHVQSYKAGEYRFEAGMTPQQISEQLVAGDVIKRTLTFPEGGMNAQIIKELREEPLLHGEVHTPPEEGMLLPETYHYVRAMPRQEIVDSMKAAMRTAMDSAWQKRDASVALESPREMLILASIVEKETGVAGERAKIAAVFHNRLRLKMKLQSDPTANYGLYRRTGALKTRMMRADVEDVSEYNTYIIEGLPPSPICNPGKASIEAVAHPDVSDALYFVADGKGGHVFANTLAEHNRNVAAYRRAMRATKE